MGEQRRRYLDDREFAQRTLGAVLKLRRSQLVAAECPDCGEDELLVYAEDGKASVVCAFCSWSVNVLDKDLKLGP
jgi:Zn ribbon nucleic-acid-binding protein